MAWVKVADQKWLDAREGKPDYEACWRGNALLYSAHVNPKLDSGEFNGTAIHVYLIGAEASDEWPLNGAHYQRTIEAPELEGVPLENGEVAQVVWDRLAEEATKA